MTRSLRRALDLLRWRPLLLLTGAIALALAADAAGIGLLGVSGWFVVACFLLAADPGFNYLGPSGVVRALALARILLRYLQRLVAHAATLRWLTRLRLRLYDDVAELPRTRLGRLRSGALVDRLLRDVAALDELVLRAVVPLTALLVLLAAGVAVLAGIGPAIGLVAGIGWSAALLVAAAHAGAEPDDAPVRSAARAELVAATAAWRELAGLGAAGTLRESGTSRLRALTGTERAARVRTARSGLLVELLAGVTVVAVALAAIRGGTPTALVATAALLAAGIGDLLTGTGPALAHWRRAVAAAGRLDVTAGGTRSSPDADETAVELPGPGAPPLVLTGPSGVGKTTWLHRLRAQAERSAYQRPLLVPHTDIALTGTVADNLRIADPGLDEAAMRRLLELVELDRARITPETAVGVENRALSGGEQRRLSLARAIAARPDLLLLDEPVTGVDGPTAKRVLARLRAELPGTVLVLALHEADRVVAPSGTRWVRLTPE